MGATESLSEAVERGRDALSRGGWEEARAAFGEALERSDSAEAWEGLSWAASWLEDGAGAIEAGSTPIGCARRRATCAAPRVWRSGWGTPTSTSAGGGDRARWFARSERILEDLEPSPEHGWLAALRAAVALDSGDTAMARRLGSQARELGRAWHLTRPGDGGARHRGAGARKRGRGRGGDAVPGRGDGGRTRRRIRGLQPVCWTCCYLIYACEQVRDFDRAGQWCKKVEDFAQRMRIQFVNGVCRAHYAAVLTWHGDWAQAEEVLLEARRDLASMRPFWAPEGDRAAGRPAPPAGALRGPANSSPRWSGIRWPSSAWRSSLSTRAASTRRFGLPSGCSGSCHSRTGRSGPRRSS